MDIKKLYQVIVHFSIITTFLFSSVIHGKQKKSNTPEITFKITLADHKQLDSVYIVLYPSNVTAIAPFRKKPLYDFITSDSVFTCSVKKGYYSYRVYTYGYYALWRDRDLTVQTDSTKITAEIELFPIATHKKTNSVKIIGKFCDWDPRRGKDLAKYGDVWKLDDTSMLKFGDKYKFSVPGNIYDLNNPKVWLDKWGAGFYSVYTGADIVYKSSLYVETRQMSTAKYSGDKAQIKFAQFLADLRKYRNFRQPRNRNKVDWEAAFKEIYTDFTKLEKKYRTNYEQILLHFRIMFLTNHHLYTKELRTLLQNSPEEHELERFYKSEVFKDYFNMMLETAKKIDPKSEFFQGASFAFFMDMEEGLKYAPELLRGHEFSELKIGNFDDYFTDYALSIEKEGVPGYEGTELLWSAAYSYFKKEKHDKVKEVIHRLATKYPDSYYIRDRLIARMYNATWLKVGDMAPDFVLKKSDGNSIKLSDYRGKFVFLFFWTQGCEFSYLEIPNVESLFRTFQYKNLEVIGFSQGSENETKWIVENYKMEFPNYFADKNLIEKLGIIHWPSTFLIGPNGKIIAIDLRGTKLVERVTQKIENPEIENQFIVKE